MTSATLLDSAQLRAVLDAMPAAVFVVDRQTCIVDLNRAARQLVGLRRQPSQRQLCGELLRCCQERTAPAGCGSGPACPGCTIRNAILAAIRNRRTFRQRHTLIVLDHGTPRTLQTLVTASALRLNGTSMALVVIEDKKIRHGVVEMVNATNVVASIWAA